MPLTDHFFPQDGDADYAVNFAQLSGQSNSIDYVESGFTFTPDYTAPSVTVTDGVAYVGGGTQSTPTDEQRGATGFIVQASQRTVSLVSDTVNYLYVAPSLGADDTITVDSVTNTVNIPSPALQIGTVDTGANTYTEQNRDPNASFESVTITGGQHLPDDVEITFGADDDYTVGYDTASDAVTIDDSTGSSQLSVSDGVVRVGGNLTVGGSVDLSGSDIHDSDTGVTVYDESNGHVPVSTLEADTVTVDGGDGITAGSTVLGGAVSVSAVVSDVAGAYLADDGTNSLAVQLGSGLTGDGSGDITVDNADLANAVGTVPLAVLEADTVTVDGGDGITAGSTALGGAVSVSTVVSDVAGAYLADDGTNSLAVQLGDGLVDDGTGKITIASDTLASLTSAPVPVGASLNLGGNNVVDGGTIVYNASAGYVPQTRLENDTLQVSTGSGLTGGGNVSLGGGRTIQHADTSSQGNVSASTGNAITDITVDGFGHITEISTSSLDGRFLNASGDSLGGNALTDVGHITFSNIESLPGSQGQLGYDDSEGLLLHDGEGHRVVADGETLTGGTQVTVSGGTSAGGSPITVAHASTGGAVDQNTSGGTVIDRIYFDENGHTTGIGTRNLDNRYYTQSEVRSWVNNNADVPNADFADTASGLQGGWDTNNGPDFRYNSRRALVSNTDELTLDYGGDHGAVSTGTGSKLYEDGSRVATRSWVNNNADVPNADYADSAGNANTVDGHHAGDFHQTDQTVDAHRLVLPTGTDKWA